MKLYTIPPEEPIKVQFPYACAPAFLARPTRNTRQAPHVPVHALLARSAQLRQRGKRLIVQEAHVRTQQDDAIEPWPHSSIHGLTDVRLMPSSCVADCPEGSTAARPCPPGTYSNELNLQSADQCIDCPAGSFCATGVIVPTPCAPGSFTNSTGQSQCQSCTDGTYQSLPGQSKCNICGAGNYSANILSCEPCQIGEVCPLGATTGQRCPIGFTTLGRAAQSISDCGCFPGFFEKNATDPQCVRCPPGSICVNATTKLEELPVAPGFWRQHNNAEEMRPCFTKAACLGGTNVNEQCARGQRGPYCAVCDEGFVGGGDGALCVSCADGSLLRTLMPGIIIFIVTVLLLGYVLISCWQGKDISHMLTRAVEMDGAKLQRVVSSAFEGSMKRAVTRVSKKKGDDRAEAGAEEASESWFARISNKLEGASVKVKIIVALFQMLNGIGLTFSIRYPQSYRDALNFFGSIFQLDLPKAMPLGCIMNMGFFSSLVTRTLLPLIVMLILAGIQQATQGALQQARRRCHMLHRLVLHPLSDLPLVLQRDFPSLQLRLPRRRHPDAARRL